MARSFQNGRETASMSELQIGTLKGRKEGRKEGRRKRKSDCGDYRRPSATNYNRIYGLHYGESGRRRQLDDSQKALARSAEMRLSVGRSVDRSVRPFCSPSVRSTLAVRSTLQSLLVEVG